MAVDSRAETNTDRREERDGATDLVTVWNEAGFGGRELGEMLEHSTALSADGLGKCFIRTADGQPEAAEGNL